MNGRPRVAVLVVGDLGRSPRMQAHALALAEYGADVDLIGWDGSPVYPEIEAHPGIRVHRLGLPRWLARPPHARRVYALAAALTLLAQTLQLLRVLLLGLERPAVLLVQNPPFVPTIPIAWLASRIRRARLVVDWHNFGWRVLAQRLGAAHWIVRVLGSLERSSGPWAAGHLCVSRAMRDELLGSSRVSRALVLHDRPLDWPEWAGGAPREKWLRELGERIGAPAVGREGVAVVVCPTSWTADEDFDLLLDGVVQLDVLLGPKESPHSDARPRVVFVVTGRGELRARYEARIARLSLATVGLATAWLSHRDFRRLLAGADLGLCLHRSASGVDLPYKVPEMLGAGLPVGVLDYGPVIEECCTPGAGCFVFSRAEELARALFDLLGGLPDDDSALQGLRRGVAPGPSWREEWDRVAPEALGLLSLRG